MECLHLEASQTPRQKSIRLNPVIAKAASVLLVDPTRNELFVVERSAELRFLGGFCAFPGGKVCGSDKDLIPPNAGQSLPFPAESYVAAVRELFEEIGVLLARREDGSFPICGETLDYSRKKLLAQEWSFAQILERLSLHLEPGDLQFLGNLVTPPFSPTRFDTSFFLATLPTSQRADVWPGELTSGFWSSANSILEHWRRGQCHLSPPSIIILEALHDRPLVESARYLVPLLAEATAGVNRPIYFAPEVRMIPLRTEALPPQYPHQCLAAWSRSVVPLRSGANRERSTGTSLCRGGRSSGLGGPTGRDYFDPSSH